MIYTIIMYGYTCISVFVVAVLIYNLFKCKSIWEQIAAFFVIYPFILRILFIK